MDGKRIILAAHRGDRKNCPENTLPAFEAAIKQRVDMIETDVRMTKDGHLVLIHDWELKRTTDGCGLVSEMTLAELRTLDAGAWFSPSFSGTVIPTVSEFIDLIKDTNVMINWELKDYPHDVGEERAFLAADKLIADILRYGLERRSMLNSFSDRLLEYIFQKYGSAFPLHGQGIHHCVRAKDTAEVAREKLYDWCCLYPNEKGYAPLDFPENFHYCNERGIIPCVCVPDEPETYRQYVQLGCRMFTSNDIYEADKILRALRVRD